MNRAAPRVLALALALSTLPLVSQAQAQNNCNLPSGSFDQVYCQVKVLIRADTEMNSVYQQLLNKLSVSTQQVLRQTQRAWMARRDHDCVEYDAKRGDVVYTECAVEMTTGRLNFLNDRLRECTSSGCQPSKLR